MENTFKIGEAGKTIGQHYVDALELNENKIEVVETPAANEETKKSGKWYEQENAFPFNEGDIVVITNINKHKGLIGRYCQVVKPSAKKNALKAFLINPKNGQPQNTMITLEFGYVELVINKDNELVG